MSKKPHNVMHGRWKDTRITNIDWNTYLQDGEKKQKTWQRSCSKHPVQLLGCQQQFREKYI